MATNYFIIHEIGQQYDKTKNKPNNFNKLN